MIETTEDRFLGGQVSIRQPKKGYRAGIDPVLLAAAIPAKAGQSVLELGTGVGTALVCLAARVPDLFLVGVDVQSDLTQLASENLDRNGISGSIVCADLADLPADLRATSFDHVIANPPYFRRERGTEADNPGRETGRGEDLPLSVWVDMATRRLAPGGQLTLIQNAARLQDLLAVCDERLGSLVVRPIAPRAGRAARLVILTAVKGGRGDLQVAAPFVLHEGDRHEGDRDSYTPAAKSILRDGSALPT